MKGEWIYGIHVVRSVLTHAPERILEIQILDNRQDSRIAEIRNLAEQQRIAVNTLSKKAFKSHGEAILHQGVIASVQSRVALDEHDLETLLQETLGSHAHRTPPIVLVLDRVQDPHNLGACLRSADATGVTAVVVPKDCSVGLTPVVRKTASGAAEIIPFVEVTNLARCLEMLKKQGLWVMGAAGSAKQSMFEVDFQGPIAVVLGAEGVGLRRLTLEKCDVIFHIPMEGVVESLNVSVAAGICLYEVMRQRRFPAGCGTKGL